MQIITFFILANTEDTIEDHSIISVLAVIFLILATVWLFIKDFQARKWEKGMFPLDTEPNMTNVAKAYAVSCIYMIQRDNRKIREKISFLQSYHSVNFKEVDLDIKERIQWSFDYPISPISVADWMNKIDLPREEKLKFVTFLVDLCFIDGAVIRAEYFIIRSIGEKFGLDSKSIENILTDRQPRDHFADDIINDQNALRKNALLILELEEDATLDTIKKRYRMLAKKYHPDKNNNKSESEKTILMSRFIKITEAYEYLTNIQN